jgi:adenine-specific DNA-methyltransferase
LYNVALNKDGTTDIKKLFNGEKPFSYPKPVKLLKILIQSASKSGDIVLDFFAGSGTTGQAVLELAKSGEQRQFILIEQMDYINDVTVPRIVRSLDLYNSEKSFVYCELRQDEKSTVSSKTKTFTRIFNAFNK